MLGHVLQVLVLPPSGSANDYTGFIVEEDRLVVWTDRFVVGQTDSLLDSHHSYSEKSQSFYIFTAISDHSIGKKIKIQYVADNAG